MKRFGEKATREAIANGAIIRNWDWYTLEAGYRVIIDGEVAGYIVSDLFFKLKNEGAIVKDHWAHSHTDYKAAETAQDATSTDDQDSSENAAEAAKTAQEWAEESERVQAATLAALAPVIATEDENNGDFPDEETTENTEPEYLDERWPESNEAAGIWYSIDYVEGLPTIHSSVADFRTAVHQAQHNGRMIAAAWRHDGNTWTRRAIIPETSQEKTDRENREHCKRIADDLEAYAAGNMYKCPGCGQVHAWGDIEETEHEDDCGWAVYTCPDCGAENHDNEWEQMSLYDYFSDCLDVEYRCGSDREYRSVSIMVACGGPNIYIDTEEKAVLLYWWTDRARYYLSSDAVDAVDDWAREYWECL